MALNITNNIYHHKRGKNLLDSLLFAVSILLFLLPMPAIASILFGINILTFIVIWMPAIYLLSYLYVKFERIYIQKKYWLAIVAMQSLALIILMVILW